MHVRHTNRLAWCIGVAAVLCGLSIACSKEEPPPASPSSAGQAQAFRFAPPDGTEYVRTDRRSEEVAIVGTPLRRVEEEELRWQTGVERKGDRYRVKQELVFISFARDGQTLAKGKVRDGISAELVIDEDGNLMDVKGLEKTADTLRSLFASGKEKEAEQYITADSLAYLVASRYQVLVGDTIGRPSAPGSTWTITSPPGSFISSRTVTVTRHEACDSTTCARLQVDFKLDPRVVADSAVKIVKSRVVSAGGDPSKVAVGRASYGMSGWMLVEPATMLSHGASLTEGGIVTVADSAEQQVTVEVKGTTDFTYAYSRMPSAAASRARPSLAAE